MRIWQKWAERLKGSGVAGIKSSLREATGRREQARGRFGPHASRLAANAFFILLSLHPFNPLTLKPVFAQEPFYKGKTMRVIVGYAAGGGYDLYSRTIARHIGKHIPGHPTIIVENMTGAGSLIAANHVYKMAKPDGLTIGHFSGVLFLGQALGQKGIEFDALNFEYIGVPA